MTWKATGAQRLFPLLEADLEVAGLGATRTQLSISARYRPPMGPLGRVLFERCSTGSPRQPSRTSSTASSGDREARPRNRRPVGCSTDG